MTDPNLDNSLRSFHLSLRAGNRSSQTVSQYAFSVRRFFGHLKDLNQEERFPLEMTADDVNAWLVSLRELGRAEATVRHRYAGLMAFFHWLEDDMPPTWRNPMARVPAPKVAETSKDVVSVEHMGLLLSTLDGAKEFRDAAIISLFYDTGMRVSELIRLAWGDIDLDNGEVVLERTKNGEPRVVPISPPTAARLDRWERKRPDKLALWVWTGQKGRLTRSGVLQMVKRRFESIGVEGIGPHDLRHTFATHYLADPQAREGDLMTIAGWKSEKMLKRYTRQGQQRRAIVAHRRLSPVARLG